MTVSSANQNQMVWWMDGKHGRTFTRSFYPSLSVYRIQAEQSHLFLLVQLRISCKSAPWDWLPCAAVKHVVHSEELTVPFFITFSIWKCQFWYKNVNQSRRYCSIHINLFSRGHCLQLGIAFSSLPSSSTYLSIKEDNWLWNPWKIKADWKQSLLEVGKTVSEPAVV